MVLPLENMFEYLGMALYQHFMEVHMNKLRQRIWSKSGGLCWYCGTTLPEKGWHMDHFLPVVRHLITGVPEYPERDCEDNLVPSCPSCNRAKSSMPLESWRKIIKGHVVSLNRDSTQYKIAKRYGLVSEPKIEVKFWFEKQNEKHDDLPSLKGIKPIKVDRG